MATTYPFLFDLCSNPQISLPEVITSKGQSVTFIRTLTGVVKFEWQEVLHILDTFNVDASPDQITWLWESNGKFSVKSLYQFLGFGGTQELHTMEWWNLTMPPKIRVFMLLLSKNKILTKNNLTTKGWLGNQTCSFCLDEETADHLFFNCNKAR